jgi:hypothetical protein
LGKYDILIGLGVVGIGGYLFVTQLWPTLKQQLDSALGPGEEESSSEEREIPQRIAEAAPLQSLPLPYPYSRPQLVVEDRYPDYIVEDRYPDVVINPPPIIRTPPPVLGGPILPPRLCDFDEYWDGSRCRRITDCPAGFKFDKELGICEPRCPEGFYFKASEGRCVLLDRPCDRGEYFDGRRCRDLPRRRLNNDNRRRRPIITNTRRPPSVILLGKTPELDRLREITERAKQNFLEVWPYY